MRTLIIFMFCSFCSFSQQVERHDSIPAIKSIFEQSFKVRKSGEKIEKLERAWHLYYQNDRYEEFDRDNELITIIDYENGVLEEITRFEHFENKDLKSIADYRINRDGDTVLTYFTQYYYDQKGFCYRDSSFNPDSSLNLLTLAAYDYDKNIAVNKVLYPDGQILYYYFEYYDANNELIKTESYDEFNRLESTTHFKRDSIERINAYYTIEREDTSSYSYTQLNEHGLPILEVFYYPTEYDSEMKYTYDYKLNDYGDWIIQFIYKEGKLEFMVEREIKYWD